MEIKKAVIYCRVSTKEQAEEGNSLATQERNCREYAIKNSYEIVSVYIEQGESAKTSDRTELKKLMGFCTSKKNAIRAVIAYKIDRISRNMDDYSQIRILLKRYGVEIKSTSENFEDTPAGRFMENIIANVAQFDNDVRTERSVGGLRDAVREGRFVWMAPYGYSNVKIEGKSTIAPNQQTALVRKAFTLVAKDIFTVESIRQNLIEEGLLNKTGKPISKAHFYRMLRNEIYTGRIIKFNETHQGNFEPLITEDLFARVQAVLSPQKNSNKKYFRISKDFPLRKFLIHPNGQKLTGCWSKGRYKKYPYYLFHHQKINIRKELLEKWFVDTLNMFQMDDSVLDQLMLKIKSKLSTGISAHRIETGKLKTRLEELKKKQTVLLDKNIEGIISNELCKEKMLEISNEIYNINETLKEDPNQKIDYSILSPILRNVLKSPGDAWEKSDILDKIKLQWFYFPEGIIFDGKESRTNKICRLLQLKKHFVTGKSPVVPHWFSKSNTQNLQISLRYDLKPDSISSNGITSELFWQEVGGEIEYLANLINHKENY